MGYLAATLAHVQTTTIHHTAATALVGDLSATRRRNDEVGGKI